MPVLAGFVLVLLGPTTVWAANDLVIWDYDRIASEPLGAWRFLAVDRDDAPLPAPPPTRLALVDLPWQLERTRPLGYWLRHVTVPERFAGRDVLLEVDTRGPTRVLINGTAAGARVSAERGTLRVPLVRTDARGGFFAMAVSVRHGSAPAAFIAARLVAEPAGFSALVARRGQLLQTLPALFVDAASAAWRVKVSGPPAAARTDFDDSTWQEGGKDFQWPDQYTPCWFRARLVVPEQIAGRPTHGKQLNLRARFNDEGTIFLNGKQLRPAPAPPEGVAFYVPRDVKPGQQVLVALRILNKWGSGRLDELQWRFAEFDEAERDLHRLTTEMTAIDRVLQLYERPAPEWLATLDRALDLLEAGLQHVEQLPAKTKEALAVLDEATTMLATAPIILLPPYLQDVRPDRLTVMWETSGPVASRVEFGKGGLRQKVEDVRSSSRIHLTIRRGAPATTVSISLPVAAAAASTTTSTTSGARSTCPITRRRRIRTSQTKAGTTSTTTAGFEWLGRRWHSRPVRSFPTAATAV